MCCIAFTTFDCMKSAKCVHFLPNGPDRFQLRNFRVGKLDVREVGVSGVEDGQITPIEVNTTFMGMEGGCVLVSVASARLQFWKFGAGCICPTQVGFGQCLAACDHSSYTHSSSPD